MQNAIIEQCLSALQKEEFKNDIKSWLKPASTVILGEIYPYIYLLAVFIVVGFLLQLGTFALLLRVRRAVISNDA
tara:strand:- start:260 stop:484 length:225 start_codon:yes stop_codon:yes gene_type:complete